MGYLVFASTSGTSSIQDLFLKPNITIYPTNSRPDAAVLDECDFSKAEMNFEGKSDHTKDIFASLDSLIDDKKPFAKSSPYSQYVRGRITAQLGHIFRTQYRVSTFSRFISTELVRLIYCD